MSKTLRSFVLLEELILGDDTDWFGTIKRGCIENEISFEVCNKSCTIGYNNNVICVTSDVLNVYDALYSIVEANYQLFSEDDNYKYVDNMIKNIFDWCTQ